MPTRSYYSWIAIPVLNHEVCEELQAKLKSATSLVQQEYINKSV